MVTETMNAVKNVRAAEGVAEVLVPGEPEVRNRELRRREGIAIPEQTRSELAEIGKRYGVELPECRAS
jgi:LDH2 family malate/lactate/ureidoglycolate dehydrogenase